MTQCNNCNFDGREVNKMYRDENGGGHYYCDYCSEIVRNNNIRKKMGVLFGEDKNSEEIITRLKEENQRLESLLKRERITFEEALNKAEEWHQRQKSEIIAERDKRISQLEKLLQDKEIAELRRDINKLTNQVSELTIQVQEQQAQIQVSPKK